MSKKNIIIRSYLTLTTSVIVISIVCVLLTQLLKTLTKHFQELIFHNAGNVSIVLYIFLPTIGITAIYFFKKTHF